MPFIFDIYKSFLKLPDRRTNNEKELHIILDNLSAHKTQAARERFASKPCIHFHFTPTNSSWLNALEGWYSQLERRALFRGVFTSPQELKDELKRFIKVHNAKSAKLFKWTKPAIISWTLLIALRMHYKIIRWPLVEKMS